MSVDTTNQFLVSTTEFEAIHVVRPPMRPLTKDEAVMFSAWLLVMARATRAEIEEAIAAVENT